MNCPHCNWRITVFHACILGPAEAGGHRLCPYCEEPFILTLNKRKAIPIATIAAGTALFMTLQFPYVGSLLGASLTVAALFFTSMRLVKQAPPPKEPTR
ncbi:hypothetical protein IQ22_00858 [Pseudomonas duriflava]|uniref:CXXC-20-CXXC protein n=1 Tax=Pseudomonas duriflava TaxID=459528 RepID=A0A562QLM0_9PSED|nr:hypothetical protein [Pseudomonas duriflava]TWI57641.1 hypothetical protein IQ22_00858 [Pseudomonas duriflava]